MRPCSGCPASGSPAPSASSQPGGPDPCPSHGLKKLGVVLKRAQYFITCSGRMLEGLRVREDGILSHLAALDRPALAQVQPEQLSLFGEEGAS